MSVLSLPALPLERNRDISKHAVVGHQPFPGLRLFPLFPHAHALFLLSEVSPGPASLFGHLGGIEQPRQLHLQFGAPAHGPVQQFAALSPSARLPVDVKGERHCNHAGPPDRNARSRSGRPSRNPPPRISVPLLAKRMSARILRRTEGPCRTSYTALIPRNQQLKI